uniref:Uncharacterized protein n=1 Tax=Kalanchoe fedtschenkoi TaxID=63787 RepID=A0A7N0UN97_KALFE
MINPTVINSLSLTTRHPYPLLYHSSFPLSHISGEGCSPHQIDSGKIHSTTSHATVRIQIGPRHVSPEQPPPSKTAPSPTGKLIGGFQKVNW